MGGIQWVPPWIRERENPVFVILYFMPDVDFEWGMNHSCRLENMHPTVV